MLKKIWKDPVGSKVISVGLIGLITLGYTTFLRVTKELTYIEALKKTSEIKVPLIYILLAIVAYWLIKYIYMKTFKTKKSYYSPKQQKLRKFNKFENSEAGVLHRWEVYFNNETPFIYNLTAYCTKHGDTPIRFINNRCSFNDCANYRIRIEKHKIKNYLESELIQQWEDLN